MQIRFSILCSLIALALPSSYGADAKRPSFVFAIADDWGWPHAGAYGDQAVQTPNFDRIANEGVLFQHAHVSSPSCTPSRGSILTGQHFWRLEAGANLYATWPDNKFSEFPKSLAEAGYHVGTYRKSWGPGQGRNPAGTSYKSPKDFFAARKDDQPFCFWFGASDPHRDYEKDSGAKAGIPLEKVHLFPAFPDTSEVRGDVADYYFEVQRFDRDLGELVTLLQEMDEFENTYVMVTGDHGMPFPRCKGNVYDSGSQVPLAIRGPGVIGSRSVTDFVSLTDIAPTILEAAGVEVPDQMTGRSLLPILRSEKDGRVDAKRDHIFFGRERHVVAQEAPNRGGYPVRAIRTDDFLYIRNYEPDRWPAGTPDYRHAAVENGWLADCDNGPTKTVIWRNRESADGKVKFDLCFGKRPAEELYDLANDPNQMKNVAGEAKYVSAKEKLSVQLNKELHKTGDPRVLGNGKMFDSFPYTGGVPKWEGG